MHHRILRSHGVLNVFFIAAFLAASTTWAAFPHPAESQYGMVASANPHATKAGLKMLRRGGNAIDAAVATAFAIGVVEPFSAGIGGGGFAIIYHEKENKVEALDFRERAPLTAKRDLYIDERGEPRPDWSRDGYRSVAVPGTVAGLYALHKKWGKLPWKLVVSPAARLAEEGFPIGWRYRKMAEWRKDLLLIHPESRRIFLPNNKVPSLGTVLKQKDLARTLRLIGQDPRIFYEGAIAHHITEDMKKNGGLISMTDLKSYKPVWRDPVCGTFFEHRICSMPPPSSGGVHLIQILNMISEEDLQADSWHHPDILHLLGESMRVAYADRAKHLGDPAFFDVPVGVLTSLAYAKKRRAEIDMKKVRRSTDVHAASPELIRSFRKRAESTETSHLTVVDQDHNAVSMTFTINYPFGAGVVSPKTGILLNDEMDDFAIAPGVPNAYGLVGDEANAVAPTKIPLSSMTPVVVTKKNKLKLVAGSPGGSTIITTLLQIILGVLVYDLNAAEAVAAPRIHHQWMPDKFYVEPFGFDALTIEELRRRGHQVENKDPWGNANAIIIREDGIIEGAADPRGEGLAQGP